ncbi:MAG: acyltransferase, partial [Henriciella sp.]|nr:acyltransferase [Henriciella sp.]
EWVADKRSPAKTRETLKRASEAFEAEKCVVIFPSGKLAKKVDGVLTEQAWFPTVVSLARKQGAPIVPMNVRAENSRLFYRLSEINGELRDITLFHELLNKKQARFELTHGKTIPT